MSEEGMYLAVIVIFFILLIISVVYMLASGMVQWT